jgi:hypothetical protein
VRIVAGEACGGERQQRRHQLIVRADRQHDQRPARQRDAHRLALTSIELTAAPLPTMQAGGLQSLLAELAGAVRPGEWRNNQVALLHGSDG